MKYAVNKMTRLAQTSLFLLFTFSFAHANDASQVADLWDAILEKHHGKGTLEGIPVALLDYRAIQKDPQWTELIDALEKANIPADNTAAKAFWLNAYNILAVKLVLSEYPVESIKKVGPWYKQAWDVKAGYVDGKKYSIGHIEHKIIRKMGDPLVHAGIVCASLSCPNLFPKAYRPENVNNRLEQQMRTFLSKTEKGARFQGNTLYVSLIFELFEEDFEQSHGSVRAFLKEYLPNKLSKRLNEDTDLEYLDYNWSLNDQARVQ